MLAIAKDFAIRAMGASLVLCGAIGAYTMGVYPADGLGSFGECVSFLLMILGAAMALMGATESRA